MAPPSRTLRVGEQIRDIIAELLTFTVRDPGIGFITITEVKVTPDLQQARVYYTTMGDDKARRETQRGLERARPMMRRALGQHMHLKRVPELQFFFDRAVERQDRIERILLELQQEREARGELAPDPATPADAAPGSHIEGSPHNDGHGDD
jgi:ribosome-binding factor A